MLKLTLPQNITESGLALPTSTPRTLIEVDSENLPYACQCPLCGGLFNIPEGLLYKIEEDNLLDGTFDVANAENTDIDIDMGSSMSDSNSSAPTGESSNAEVGESNDTAI